jgi:phage gpG-like protein
MPGDEITINGDELLKRVDAITKTPLTGFYPVIGQIGITSIEENFLAGGRYMSIGGGEYSGGSQQWKPSKRAIAQGGRTLQNRGLLASRISFRAGSDGITWTSGMEYSAIQHYGGRINHPGGTPYVIIGGRARFLKKDGVYPAGTKFTRPHIIVLEARPYLVFQDEDLEDMATEYAKWLGHA